MKKNYQNSMESVVSTLDERNEMVVLDGKTVNVKLDEGEFIAWMVEGDLDMVPFKTEKECKEYRAREWGSCYESEEDMDELIPVCQYIFTGDDGLEEDIPVCPIEDRIDETIQESKQQLTEGDFKGRLESNEGKNKSKKYVLTHIERNNHDNTFKIGHDIYKTKREAMVAMRYLVDKLKGRFPDYDETWYDIQTCSFYYGIDRSESRYVTDYCVLEAIEVESGMLKKNIRTIRPYNTVYFKEQLESNEEKNKSKYVLTCVETNNHDNTFGMFHFIYKTKREAMADMKHLVRLYSELYQNETWYDKHTCSLYNCNDRNESRYVTDLCVRETNEVE